MRKLRKQAKELLHSASKVFHYRRDLLSENDLQELERSVSELNELSKDKSVTSDALYHATKEMDTLLRRIGGKIHPKTFWNDNIEVILVAAIIVIGIRTFFFQPFIIPTNSMYPTYSGMNSVIYDTATEQEPTLPTRLFRFATLGAKHKSLSAQNSGSLTLQLNYDSSGRVSYKERVRGRKWVVLNGWFDQYTFLVDGVPHLLRVPAEFDIRPVLKDVFDLDFPIYDSRKIIPGTAQIDLNRSVQAGETILRFDITLGDALFVDRISYHFKKPAAGDPFVFKTDAIVEAVGQATGDYTPKYYIKRIAGSEEEKLSIKEGVLYVNGQARDESEAFTRNAERDGDYGGYVNEGQLDSGLELQIPENRYVALGDNSANSADSRYWGFVPDTSVIGRALFIYYPFTKRWGPSE